MAHRREPTSLADALAKDLPLVLLGVAVVFLILVYLPAGVVAVAAQDGMNDTMREGLGIQAPLPIRLFRALQTGIWPVGVVAGFLAALLHVVLRRVVRRDTDFGDDLAWDTLRSPLLVLAAVVAVGSVALEILGPQIGMAGSDFLFGGAVASGFAFVVLSVSGAGTALLSRSRGLRWAIGIAVLVAVATRLGADVWGRSRLATYDAQWEKEVAAERQKRATTERPILRGQPLDEDAAPRYHKLFESWRSQAAAPSDVPLLRDAVEQGPFEPIPEAAKALLDRGRADVAALREATRCRRCLLGMDFDPVMAVNPPLFGPIRSLSGLLALEGRERALMGDLRGAAERYMDVVRFGGDVAPGALINTLHGLGAEETGLKAVGQIVISGRLDGPLVEQIEKERAVLERDRVSLAEGFRADRFFFGHLDRTISASPSQVGLDEPLILGWAVPYRALAARALSVADPIHQEFERAMEAGDLEAWKRATEDARVKAGSSLNPLTRTLAGFSGPWSEDSWGLRLLMNARRGRALFRLVEGAVRVERRRLQDGRYPTEAASLDLPADPFASGSPLRYALDANGFRLWSVGFDGKDDGGQSDRETDLVLERRGAKRKP